MRHRHPWRPLLVALLGVGLLTCGLAGTASAAPAARDFGPSIDALASYDAQKTCDPTPKPGVVAVRALVLAAYPGTFDDGISRDCSQGGISEHKEGRAWDWGVSALDATQKAKADDLIAWLLATDKYGNRYANARRLGVMYIIWNKRIWGAYATDQGWRDYTGADPHTSHVHISFSWAGAREQTSWWTAPDYQAPPVTREQWHGGATGQPNRPVAIAVPLVESTVTYAEDYGTVLDWARYRR